MSNNANAPEAEGKRLEVAIEIRNFEIELFWKRSVFFWGFISSAFIGYAALRTGSPSLSLLVACFGMVCSFAWTLLNRGSKYWQESWETKVEAFEIPVTGKVFAQEELVQSHKGPWLQARRFSVSKLAIALSDYVFFLWTCLVAVEFVRKYVPSHIGGFEAYAPGAFALASVAYLGLLLWRGRSTPRSENAAGPGRGPRIRTPSDEKDGQDRAVLSSPFALVSGIVLLVFIVGELLAFSHGRSGHNSVIGNWPLLGVLLWGVMCAFGLVIWSLRTVFGFHWIGNPTLSMVGGVSGVILTAVALAFALEGEGSQDEVSKEQTAILCAQIHLLQSIDERLGRGDKEEGTGSRKTSSRGEEACAR
jgi:hypothetical protein